MRLALLLVAVGCLYAQPSVLPNCSATRTTNCSVKADASGSVTVGTKVLTAKCDGVTDMTSAINTQLAALYTAGGGSLVLSGMCLISGQLVIPNDAQTVPAQPSLRITGNGASANGVWTALPSSASGLDLRVNAAVAKIDTRGKGMLEIDHLALVDGGSDCSAFIQTTNTTLHIHDVAFSGTATGASACNDAIVLGGTVASAGGAATSAFQGYGTVIRDNFFDKIQRGVYGRVWSNAIVVSSNTWSPTCGGGSGVAAIMFDGTTGFSFDNVLVGNLIEVSNYVYGVYALNATLTGYGNSLWDPLAGTLGGFRLTGTSSASCYGCTLAGTAPVVADGGASTSAMQYTAANGVVWGNFTYSSNSQPLLVRPEPKAATEAVELIGVHRSTTDSSNPNGVVWKVSQGGNMLLAGLSASPAANFAITNSTQTLTYDHNSIVKNTGNIDIYPGPSSSAIVNIARGVLKIPQYTTVARPSASAVGVGANYFDTTLGYSLWSNGTNWVDGAGAVH